MYGRCEQLDRSQQRTDLSVCWTVSSHWSKNLSIAMPITTNRRSVSVGLITSRPLTGPKVSAALPAAGFDVSRHRPARSTPRKVWYDASSCCSTSVHRYQRRSCWPPTHWSPPCPALLAGTLLDGRACIAGRPRQSTPQQRQGPIVLQRTTRAGRKAS